jgi:hypothetical protein
MRNAGDVTSAGVALVPRLLTLLLLLGAMTVAGCARNSSQVELKTPVAHKPPASRVCRSEKLSLPPPKEPDCEFKGVDVNSVDPDQFSRLKLDYERRCYQRAEKIARDRLRRLQSSRRCEIRSPGSSARC